MKHTNRECKGQQEVPEEVPAKKLCVEDNLPVNEADKNSSNVQLPLSQSNAANALPYKGPKVLILGDGNFSFSCALGHMYPGFKITATVIENEQDFKERYPSGAEILEEMERLPNVELIFCVDATALPHDWTDFNDIIFNFPHPGGKTNLKRSRELICGVFASLQNIMRLEDCRFHLALAKRQSGLDHADVVAQRYFTSSVNHSKDSWQILYLGARYGMMADTVVPFDPSLFQKYVSSGYKKRDQMFWNKDAADLISFSNHSSQLEFDLPRPTPFEGSPCFPERFHTFRPVFLHDISIIFGEQVQNEEDFGRWESELFRFIISRTPDLIVDCREVLDLRCICPKSNRPNRIYRLHWQSVNKPLHRTLCNKLQNDLRAVISQFFTVNYVPLVLT